MGVFWEVVFIVVFVEGIIFIVLLVSGVCEVVVNVILKNMKLVVIGGIGIFIVFIGLVNSGIVIGD